MAILLYHTFIWLFRLGTHLAATFNPKAKLFRQGQKGLLPAITRAVAGEQDPLVWIHCASLGEFEQARPLIEVLKQEFPRHKIFLTFFSSSGFERQKNYAHADYIYYLPYDTPHNAQMMITILKPVLAIFVKYEFWYQYLKVLREKGVPTLSASSIFRSNQSFFQPWGGFFRQLLKNFSYFFVQNEESKTLLAEIGIHNVQVSGDTRFDRVWEINRHKKHLDTIRAFKGENLLMVIGSSWPADLKLLIPFINQRPKGLKFIIAPHEIHDKGMRKIEKDLMVASTRLSRASQVPPEKSVVLIVDSVGLLSSLYAYADFAFVGGAFGDGLHNILEPAVYGMPVFFGDKNYRKFKEAVDLIDEGGAFPVSDTKNFQDQFAPLQLGEKRREVSEITKNYVLTNLGATEKIMHHCRGILTSSCKD